LKTVAVSEETWKRLKEIKERMGLQSMNDVISALIEAWHLTSLKEEFSKIDIFISYEEGLEFVKTVRKFGSKGFLKQ
jgi:predicted CopG family antitoxin